MKYSGNAISQLNYADTDKPEKLTMIENENEFFLVRDENITEILCVIC